MSSYKTFLNGVRAAISSAFNKVSQRLARFEETATQKYNELAYVPIYETPLEEFYTAVLETDQIAVGRGFPGLEVGKEYLVTIGDAQYKSVARYVKLDEATVACIGSDMLMPGGDPYRVLTIGGVGLVNVFETEVGKTMTIQLIGEPVEVGKEWLPDYAVNAQTTADKAQTTADKAQTTADKAQTTADKAQTTADNVSKKIAMGFYTEIPSYKSNKEIEYAIFPNALKVERETFAYCDRLKDAYLPSAAYIDMYAFRECGLTSIVILNGRIGAVSFVSCKNLASLTLGSGVKGIGWEAFANCTSLTSITYTGTMEQWNAVTKGTDWHTNCPATEVVCSDGSVPLTTTET